MRTSTIGLMLVAAASAATACGGSSATAPASAVTATPAPPAAAASAARRFTYPESKKGDVVDDYHGTKVPSPCRWLEDPDSPETRAWIEAQNKLTFGYLETLPSRGKDRERRYDYERFGIPEKGGKRYVYERNSGLQNQDVLYVADTLDGEPRVLLDPNVLSSDGTVALMSTALTEDGKRAHSGSISTASPKSAQGARTSAGNASKAKNMAIDERCIGLFHLDRERRRRLLRSSSRRWLAVRKDCVFPADARVSAAG